MPHSDAPLGLPTGLWLELAGLFLLLPWVMGLVGAGGPGAQGPRGLSWAVRLDGPEGEGAEELLERWADALAQATGLMNAGRIGELQGHYLLVQPAGHRQARQVKAVRQQVEAVLARHEAVRWHSEQRLLKRTKRGVHFNDPKYPQQWHLVSPALPLPSSDSQGRGTRCLWAFVCVNSSGASHPLLEKTFPWALMIGFILGLHVSCAHSQRARGLQCPARVLGPGRLGCLPLTSLCLWVHCLTSLLMERAMVIVK